MSHETELYPWTAKGLINLKNRFSLNMVAKEDKTFFEFNYEYTDFAKVCFVKLNLIGLFLSWDEGLRLLLSEMICCNTMSL